MRELASHVLNFFLITKKPPTKPMRKSAKIYLKSKINELNYKKKKLIINILKTELQTLQ